MIRPRGEIRDGGTPVHTNVDINNPVISTELESPPIPLPVLLILPSLVDARMLHWNILNAVV